METTLFFVIAGEKCCWLICNSSVAIPKKENSKRHFIALCGKYNSDYTSNNELRNKKLLELKLGLSAQRNMFLI